MYIFTFNFLNSSIEYDGNAIAGTTSIDGSPVLVTIVVAHISASTSHIFTKPGTGGLLGTSTLLITLLPHLMVLVLPLGISIVHIIIGSPWLVFNFINNH